MIRPLELRDRSLVTSYLQRTPPETSELTFTNLFVWRNSRRIWFAEVEGSLVFLVTWDEEGGTRRVILGSPVGEVPALDAASSLGVEIEGFVRIAKHTADALRKAGIAAEGDRDNWDYVYRVEDVAELAGRRFHKKRNQVKRCLGTYRCGYERMEGEVVAECLDMQERWCKARRCGVDPGLCSEYLAIRDTFAHYEELQLIGGAVRVEGRIEAYAIGEELCPGTAVCHFEKTMPRIQGLGQVINQWFTKYSLSEFEFVNREQDLGIAGLRQAKESYYPHHMVEKFNAFLVAGGGPPPSVLEPHECEKHTGV